MNSRKHDIRHTVFAGKPLDQASAAMIFVHGRGASAESILTLADHLDIPDFALAAPQATGDTWYPFSFLAPEAQNEPWLSSALELLQNLVSDIKEAGISTEHIYFTGFSQGACLTAEFLARNANRYGGALIFTGGVIGQQIQRGRYSGDFGGMPVFFGSANPDFHVPVERVYATANIFRELHAVVTEKMYPGMGHTIIPDEIEEGKKIIKFSF